MTKRIQFITNSKTPIRSFLELTNQLNIRTGNDNKYDLYLEGISHSDYLLIASGCDVDFTKITVHHVSENGRYLGPGAEKSENTEHSIEIEPATSNKHNPIYSLWLYLTESKETDPAKWSFRETLKPLLKVYLDQRKKRKNLLRWYNPSNADVIVIYSDLRVGANAHMIKMACDKNVPVVVAPTVRLPFPKIMADGTGEMYRCEDRNHLKFFERIAHSRYRNAEVSTDKTFGFRLPPYKMLIYDLFGILADNPWIMGTGNSIYAAYSDADNYQYAIENAGEYYRKRFGYFNSIEETTVIDRYKNNRVSDKKELVEKYGLKPNDIICFALSAYAKSSLPITYDEEVDIYKAILTDLIKGCDRILVSLHPIMDRDDYLWITEAFSGVVIAEEPLYRILPAVDVLVYSSNSSVLNLVRKLPIKSIILPHDEIVEGKLSDNTEQLLRMCCDADSDCDVSRELISGNDFADYIVEEYLN